MLFAGKFAGTPDDHAIVLGARPEQCVGSCMVELSTQLAIIMIGQQLFNNVMEVLMPILLRLYSMFSAGAKCGYAITDVAILDFQILNCFFFR